MKNFIITALLSISTIMATSQNIYDFQVASLTGGTIDFSEFEGKKILIVNTASECGYTPQYEQLQELHVEHGEDIIIVGFPANNFGGQEPGSNQEIKSFCQKNYGVEFTMAEKVSVKGKDMHPLFKWLTSQENPDFTGDIRWNFEKFMINEEGQLIRRYRSGVSPVDEEILGQI